MTSPFKLLVFVRAFEKNVKFQKFNTENVILIKIKMDILKNVLAANGA